MDKDQRLNRLCTHILSNELISCDLTSWNCQDVAIFKEPFVNSQANLGCFKNQLIQHNLLVVAKYYKKIYLQRLCELCGVTLSEIERELCELITSKQVAAKIDRPSGIVNFIVRKTEDEILDDWATDVNRVLDLIDNTSNLIQREQESEAQPAP